MIISHKHKYIFIGLPFSGSSAISKELIEEYEGEFDCGQYEGEGKLTLKGKVYKGMFEDNRLVEDANASKK